MESKSVCQPVSHNQSRLVVLIDIGSTFTKGILLDLFLKKIIAKHSTPTTINTGIQDGFYIIINAFSKYLPRKNKFWNILVSSSAAGGLKIVVAGLTPSLSLKAGEQISFNAGAKVVGSFSHKITGDDIDDIERLSPDIILITGGIDGGDEETILYNSSMLSKLTCSPFFVIAGNKVVASDNEKIMADAEKQYVVTENVLPELNIINIEPVRKTIRNIFQEKIIYSKGLEKIAKQTNTQIIPTPSAVLNAAQLFSAGFDNQPGIGPLLVVDIGGATTDIHSIGPQQSTENLIIKRGLPEPYIKRTVEGDIGLRASSKTLIENVEKGGNYIISDGLVEYVNYISENNYFIPDKPEQKEFDIRLAELSIAYSFSRHCGYFKTVNTINGEIIIQEGKDLSGIKKIIGTGGIFSTDNVQSGFLQKAFHTIDNDFLLKPKNPEYLIDHDYILWAAGLLADIDRELSFKLMKNSLA